jgi:hypothetical protein
MLRSHATKESAYKQEAAIHSNSSVARVVAALDEVAEELEEREEVDLQEATDSLAYEFERLRVEELNELGFDRVEKRREDVAEEIYDDRIDPMPYEQLVH